jgi:hypothetical protein
MLYISVPKPPSLEFTKKRKSEHEFPMTPTGYPQPPTPDFPPPSPNTARKGIEQKIAGIEVPSVSVYCDTALTYNILSRNESGRFGVLKSDSTHHFFRNACSKSGFSQFSGC